MAYMDAVRRDLAALRRQAASQLTNYDVTVESTDPLVVLLPDGTPFEGAILAGAQVQATQRAVLQVGGGRAWVYPQVQPGDPAPGDIPEDVETMLASLAIAQESIGEQIAQTVADVSDGALVSASAAGILIQPYGQPRPETRPNGIALSDGDLLYVLNASGQIADVRIRLAGGADDGWPRYVFAAADVLATGSIVGSLIAASQAIQSPVITGGSMSGVDIYSPSATAAPRVHMGSSVVEIIRPDNEGGEYRSISLGGATSDEIALYDAAGDPIAGFTPEGTGSVRGMMSVGDLTVGGDRIADLLAAAPRGVIGTYRTTSASAQADASDIGLVRFSSLPMYTDRVYRLTLSGSLQSTGANLNAHFKVFYKSGGLPLTISNGYLIAQIYRGASSSDTMRTADWELLFSPLQDNAYTSMVLVTLRSNTAGQPVNLFGGSGSGWSIYLEDAGPRSQIESGELTLAGGTPYGSYTPPVETPTKTYTKTYTAEAVRSWRGGSIITSELGHGYWGGLQRYSMVGFPASMVTDLSGATVKKTEVYLRNTHTWNGSSMTARIGRSNTVVSGSAPASFPTGMSPQSVSWSQGAGAWVTMPAGWWLASARSITLGEGAGTGNAYYGKFSAALADCRIRHTYEK